MSIADEITRIFAAKADLKAAIESNGGSVGDGRIDTYAAQVVTVYGAGKEQGYDEGYDSGYGKGKERGYDEGYAEGQKAGGGDTYYDTFWDEYQQNGNRTGYSYAFAGGGWTDENFSPKYDITPTSGCSYMFNSTNITDIKNIGVTIDFSGCTDATYLLSNSDLKTVGTLDMTGAKALGYIMYNCRSLESVDRFILKSDGSNTFNDTLSFGYCSALTHCPFEGVIGQPNFNMRWSANLDRESLTSIINCLSADTEGLTVTLSKTAVDNAFETSAGAADGATSAEWLQLVGTKQNWTISLA